MVQNSTRQDGINKTFKKDELLTFLAEKLILLKDGDKLPSVRSLAKECRMGTGSISQALSLLENSECVHLTQRGRLGTNIETRSLGKLWQLVEKKPLVIALTLPSTPLNEGLATAVKKLLTEAGIEVYMTFIRGSNARLQALLDRKCHATGMSCLAAECLLNEKQTVVIRLPRKSWISEHNVYYCDDVLDMQETIRVAIDNHSFDHQFLTKLEFSGKRVEFIEASYLQARRMLERKVIDAAVWTSDYWQEYSNPDIHIKSMSEKALPYEEKSSTGVFVVRCEDRIVQAILKQTLIVDKVIEIQQKVLRGELIPEY